MILIAVDRLAIRVSEHNGVIDNAVPAFDHLARECPPRCPDLDCDFVNVIHAIDIRGYSLGLRNLSCAAFVLAYRNIISA